MTAVMVVRLRKSSTESPDEDFIPITGSDEITDNTGAGDTVDCPLWADCGVAVANGGRFSGGGVFSLTQTPVGKLYVLDAGAGTLYYVQP